MVGENDSLHILLADDDENDRLFFREALKGTKIRIIINFVNNGQQLMEYLNRTENKLPNVLFLDLNMPLKGGMESLTEIRKNIRLKDLVVVIYSTDDSEESIEEAFVRGANIYLNKTSDFLVLKSCLSQIININWQYHTLGLNKENFLLKV